MDHEIDNEKPSGKEGGEVKIGDKVWVLCEVAMIYNHESLYIDIRHDGAVFEAKRSDCRPVEPDHDDYPVEFKVGDRVMSWSGRQGVVEAINEIEGFPVTVRHSMREQVSYKLGGVKHDDRPVEPANSPEIPDSSNEPMRAAFESSMAKRYDWYQGYFSRNENRYFDSSVEMAWQAFQAGAKYQSSPLAPSPCMDGVDVDQFVEGVMAARGRVGDPINPSHYKHLPAEAIDIIEAAIAKAPSNQYAFLQGQVIKYLLRCWSKKGIEDLRKAKWYLDRLVGGFDELLAEVSGANDGQKEVGE
jgi:hypothetical protein